MSVFQALLGGEVTGLLGGGLAADDSRNSLVNAGRSEESQKSMNTRSRNASIDVYEHLPAFSIAQEAVDHIVSMEDGGQVDIATCLGPAVPHMRKAALLEAIGMLCFFPITYISRAYNLNWIWKYMFLAPVGVYHIYAEWEALRYFIPPYVYDGVRHTAGLWKVFGFAADFRVWLAVYSFFTVLNTSDTFLDTGFSASTVFLTTHDGGQTQKVYEEMWRGGLLGMLPCPNIAWSVVLMWLCTLAQPIANLIFTLPKGPVTYAVGESGLQHYLFQRLNFEGVFFFLSAASGMSSISSLEFRQGTHELARIQPEEMISYVQPMAVAMFKRCLYSWFLRNSIQLNFQTLLFSIHMHSGVVETQTQTAVSIAVSIMMTLQKLTDLKSFEKYIEKAKDLWASDEELDKYIEKNPDNYLFKEWKDGFWKLQWAIRAAAMLTIGSLSFASYRLVMSTLVCDSHLWEVFVGCID